MRQIIQFNSDKGMKKLLILGAGTAGTIMANKMRKSLSENEWNICLIDKYQSHYYQPGFLFVPFGIYSPKEVTKPKKQFIDKGIELLFEGIDKINPGENIVLLENSQSLHYDYLIIATGARIVPSETPGLKGDLWYKKIFDFYTPEGAEALGKFFVNWKGGELVINIAEQPIKCPVAPLEFAMLADSYFIKKGIRDKVNITYVTPLSGAFTKPKASEVLGSMLEEKHINIVPDFCLSEVDNENQKILDYGGKEVKFDVLITIPVHMGSEVIERSGMGDDLHFVPTDKLTLRSQKYENIFVLGDAWNIPASKAGSVIHFAAEVLKENLLSAISGKPLEAKFDGHANCYVETGHSRAALIDFNYETEPMAGTYPMPVFGPFRLLKKSWLNHLGKLAFRWIYWHILLKARHLPVSNAMSMIGKHS
jgi:sulfide:quinone oxidoreductase